MDDVTLNINLDVKISDSPGLEKLLTDFIRKWEIRMAALDDQIASLQAEVARNTTVEKSALALIQGFAQKLADAIAAATAAGATSAQLDALTALKTTITSNDDELAAAVQANTTPPTT